MEVLTESDHAYRAKLILNRNYVQTHLAPLLSEDQPEHKRICFLPNIYTPNARVIQAKTDVTWESEQLCKQILWEKSSCGGAAVTLSSGSSLNKLYLLGQEEESAE